MTRKHLKIATAVLTALVSISLFARPSAARAPQQEQQKPAYTIPEYNAFQAANTQKDPQEKIKLLDDFVMKFPNSTLMQYVDQLYYQAYFQLKNYPKTIEYADKLVALGDKIEPAIRLQALQTRVQAFAAMPVNPSAPDANDQLTKERDAALQGAKLLESFPKPANVNMSDADFAKQKKPGIAFFDFSAASASLQLKDYAGAVTSFKAALANKPDDPVSEYRMGLAYLAMNPPQSLEGFWALARAVDLKVPDSDKVKTYLRAKVLAYEQPGCDSQVDAQMNEMLQLASSAPEPPSTYTIPSADDLNKIRQASNIITVISDLSGGGDKAKMTWLAICGAEFPEVVGKIIDIQKTDSAVDFMVFTGATPEEMQSATTANMDVKVWITAPPAGSTPAPAAGAAATPPAQIQPQPDVVRLQKDDGIRFSGALVSYDPTPFLLHWDQVKVDPSVIPAEAGGKRAPRKVPAK
jgi:tetratricopeptide (TPR) repeat protein